MCVFHTYACVIKIINLRVPGIKVVKQEMMVVKRENPQLLGIVALWENPCFGIKPTMLSRDFLILLQCQLARNFPS